jgi:hypothetical protein
MSGRHPDIQDASELHRPTHYQQATDPGAVGAWKWWLDTDDGKVYVRNAANTAWLDISAGVHTHTEADITDFAHTHPSTDTTDFAEAVRDTIGAALTAGNNIDITVNDPGDTITIDVEALTSADISDLAEFVRDTVGTSLVAGTNVTITPDDPTDTITVAATGGGLTQEQVEDVVAALVAAGKGLTATYNDAGNLLTIDNDWEYTTVSFLIDGGGSAITTGVKGDLGPFDFAGVVEAWTALADQSGSIVVDIWKDSYANFPPTVADTITGAEKPTISAATKGQDTSLAAGTGWAIAVGDIWRFNVDSAATVTRVTLSFKVRRT